MVRIDIGIPRDPGGLFLFSKKELEERGALDDFKNPISINVSLKALAKKRTMEFYENDLQNR